MTTWLVVALGRSNYPGELAISTFLKVTTAGNPPTEDEVIEALRIKREAAEKSDNPSDIFRAMFPKDYVECKYITRKDLLELMGMS